MGRPEPDPFTALAFRRENLGIPFAFEENSEVLSITKKRDDCGPS